MKRVYTAITSVCPGPAADAAAAAPEGFPTGEGAVILLPRLALSTYPVVTRIPFCSASAQLSGATAAPLMPVDRKSTRLNSSHLVISYAVFCLKKKKK